jgi:hypothetical protein
LAHPITFSTAEGWREHVRGVINFDKLKIRILRIRAHLMVNEKEVVQYLLLYDITTTQKGCTAALDTLYKCMEEWEVTTVMFEIELGCAQGLHRGAFSCDCCGGWEMW